MKKLVLTLVGAMFIAVASVNAKSLPAVAAKLPASFKTEIEKQLDYPNFAKRHNIEGDVWMKVTLDDNSHVKIVDLSATNPELGKFVVEELSDLYVEDKSFPNGNVYFLKVKFDIIEE